jgi:hypothetical protein
MGVNNNMKKAHSYLILLLAIAVLAVVTIACRFSSLSISEQPTDAPTDPTLPTNTPTDIPIPTSTPEPETLELLSGYPVELVPLYNNIKLEYCSFLVRDNSDYGIGKDIYTVDYLTQGTLKEVGDFYRGMMTSIDYESEESDTEDYFNGVIGTQRVNVGLREQEDGILKVVLGVGQKPEDYVTENPYFADYPQDLIEIIGTYSITDVTYEERMLGNSSKTIRYVTSGTTELTADEFSTFYKNKYSEMEGFTETIDEYSIDYYWYSQGYQCEVHYSPSEGEYLAGFVIVISK